METSVLVKMALLTLAFILNHQQEKDFYIESWEKGPSQVQEQKLQIEMNADRPEYEASIRDSTGRTRYKLSIWPDRAGVKNIDIIGWVVELIDITKNEKVNLLRPTNDIEQDYFTDEDYVWWLHPLESTKATRGKNAALSIFTKRVIKVERFYCIIEVKGFHLSKRNRAVLDSISVQVEFTNSYPKLREHKRGRSKSWKDSKVSFHISCHESSVRPER
jgi:hypothetical protein